MAENTNTNTGEATASSFSSDKTPQQLLRESGLLSNDTLTQTDISQGNRAASASNVEAMLASGVPPEEIQDLTHGNVVPTMGPDPVAITGNVPVGSEFDMDFEQVAGTTGRIKKRLSLYGNNQIKENQLAGSVTPKQEAVANASKTKKVKLDPLAVTEDVHLTEYLYNNWQGDHGLTERQLIDKWHTEHAQFDKPYQPEPDLLENLHEATKVGLGRAGAFIVNTPQVLKASKDLKLVGQDGINAFNAFTAHEKAKTKLKELRESGAPTELLKAARDDVQASAPTKEQLAVLNSIPTDPNDTHQFGHSTRAPRQDRTVQQLLQDSITSLSEADNRLKLYESMGSDFNTKNREVFSEELVGITEKFNKVLDESAAEYGKPATDRNLAKATVNMLGAEVTLAKDMVVAAVNNPAAVLEYAVENLPQILSAVISPPTLVLHTLGYSADTFRGAVQDMIKENGGALPDQEKLTQALVMSAGAGLLEQAGALGQLRTINKLGKTGKATPPKTTSKSASIVGSTLGEGATEAGQVFLEEGAKDKKATSEQLVEGFTIGAAASATITGTIGTVKAGITKTQKLLRDEGEIEAARILGKENVQKAIVTGDLTELKKQEDPTELMTVLQYRNSSDQVDDKEKKHNAEFANNINNFVLVRAVKAAEALKAARDKKAPEAEIKELTTKAKEAKELHDKISVIHKAIKVPEAIKETGQVDADIETVSSATEATPEVQEAVKRTLFSSRKNTGAVSTKQLRVLADSGFLTKDQAVEVEEELVVRKTMSQVGDNILNGDDGFLGLNKYKELVTSSLEVGDVPAATSRLTQLQKWATHQKAKALAIRSAYNTVSAGGTLSTQQEAALRAVEVEEGQTYNIHKGSNKSGFVDQVDADARAVLAVTKQLKGAIDRAGSGESTPRVDSSAPPVNNTTSEAVTPPTQTPEVEANVDPEPVQAAESTPPVENISVEELTEVFDEQLSIDEVEQPPYDDIADYYEQYGDQDSSGVVLDEQLEEPVEVVTEEDLQEELDQLTDMIDNAQYESDMEMSLDEALERIEQIETHLSLINKTPSFNLGNLIHEQDPRTLDKDVPLVEQLFSINRLTAFFNVRTPKFNEKGGNALAQIDGFMGKLKENIGWAKPFIGRITPKRKEAIDLLLELHEAMGPAFEDVFKELDIEFKHQDMMQYLVNKDGKLHDNVLGAFSTTIFNWLATQATNTTSNDLKSIRAILQLKDTDALDENAAINLLGDVGVAKNGLAESLGKAIARTLEITPNENATPAMVGNFHSSLGGMALAMMGSLGFVERHDVPRNEIAELAATGHFLDGNASHASFYRAISTVQENGQRVVSEQIDEFVQANKGTEGMLEKMFKTPNSVIEPSLTVPDTKYTTMKGTDQKVPEEVARVLNKHEKRPYSFNSIMELFNELDDTVKQKIIGVNPDIEGTTHVNHVKAAQAKNNSLMRELAHISDFYSKAKDQVFYFTHEVWAMGRMGMATNTVNIQASTMHRHLVADEAHNVTVDLSDPVSVSQFRMALAESFGVKTDGQMNTKSDEDLNTKINHPAVQTAVQMLQSDSMDGDILVEALDVLGEGLYSLHGLKSLADYQTALASPTTTKFDNDLFREVDGKTNGVIIGGIQFGNADTVQELALSMEKGGLYFDGYEDFAAWASDPANFDSYEDIVMATNERINHLVDQDQTGEGRAMFDAVQGIFGNFTAVNQIGLTEVTKDGRNLAKNPLMIIVYGSSDEKVIDAQKADAVNFLYEKIAKIINKSDQPVNDLKDLEKHLQVLLDIKEDIFDYRDLQSNLGVELTKEYKDVLGEAVAQIIGEPMTSAIEDKYANFKTNRTESNSVMSMVNQIYFEVRNSVIERVKTNKKNQGLYISEVNNKGEEIVYYGLTLADYAWIDDQVKNLLPSVATYFSKQSGNVDENIFVGTKDSQRQYNSEYKVEQVYRTGFSWNKAGKQKRRIDGEGKEVVNNYNDPSKQQTFYSSLDTYGDTGVRPAIFNIHNIDSAIIVKVMDKLNITNIHDAGIFGQNMTEEGARALNQAFYEVMREMSIPMEITNTLDRSLKELAEYADNFDPSLNSLPDYIASEMLLPGEADRIKKLKEQGIDIKLLPASEKPKRYEGIDQFVAMSKDSAAKQERMKNEYLDGWLSRVNQYYLEGGSFSPNNEANAAIDGYTNKTKGANAANTTLGSTTDSDTFVEDFVEERTQKVNNMNLLQVFDRIGKNSHVKEDAVHLIKLRDVMDNIVNKILTKTNTGFVLKESSSTEEGRGAVVAADDQVNVYIRHQIAGTKPYTSVLNTLRMSSEELLAHEAVHAVMQAALDSSSIARNELKRLFHAVRDQVSTDQRIRAFMNNPLMDENEVGFEDEYKAATERHDHVFLNSTGDGLQEFVAMGLTNKNFGEFLNTVNPKDLDTGWWHGDSFAEKMINGFLKLLHLITESSLGTKTRKLDAESKLHSLVSQMMDLESRNKNKLLQAYDFSSEKLAKGVGKSLGLISVGARKVASSNIVRANRIQLVRLSGRVTRLVLSRAPSPIRKNLEQLAGIVAGQRNTFAEQVATELAGHGEERTSLIALNRKSNHLIDQARKQAQTAVTRAVRKMFSTKLTKEESIALTKTVLKLDMVALISGYNVEQIRNLLASNSEVQRAIDSEIAKLDATDPNYHHYLRMTRNLGSVMATGAAIEKHTQLNAHNIANLGGTAKAGTVDPQVAARIEPILDRLATLHGLTFTDHKHKVAALAVLRRESQRDPVNNGFFGLMSLHQDMKEAALDKAFNGEPYLMIKGYTKEIMNPDTELKMAPISEQQDLEEQGYVMLENAITRDGRDPVKTDVYVFVRKGGGRTQFAAGIFGLSSDSAKGTGSIQIRDQLGDVNAHITGASDQQNIIASKQADIADTFLPAPNNNIKYVKENYMIPVISPFGDVVGYRYMMQEQTKDYVLDKHNEVEDVLGAMAGSVVEKEATPKINKEAVGALLQQYNKGFKNSPASHVEIGPRSSDPYLRELYDMLPEETKEEIRKQWGSDTMIVHKSIVDLVFGSRKLSIFDMFQKDPAERTAAQEVFVNLMERMFGRRIGIRLRRGEDILKALTKEVKDAIVVKTGVVTAANVMSNNLLLAMHGVPWTNIVKHQAEGLDGILRYQKDHAARAQLRLDLNQLRRLGGTVRQIANAEARIAELDNELLINPVHDLIEAGIMQSIVEDIDDEAPTFGYKDRLNQFVADTLPSEDSRLSGITTTAKVLYMAHDTALYKALNNAVRLSDFVSRYALYKHLTEVKADKLDKNKAIEEIDAAFINYDIPTNRLLQYANDIGLLWFTKYFLRVQRIIWKVLRDHPESTLLTLLLQSFTGGAPNITDSAAFLNKDLLSVAGTPITAGIDVSGSILTAEAAQTIL